MSHSRRRPRDIEAVWASTMAVESCSANGQQPWMTLDRWQAAGCPALLDFTPAEQAVVDAFLARTTLVSTA